MSELTNVTMPAVAVETVGCPVAAWFDPGDTGAHADPFPWYRQVREEGRIVYVPTEADEPPLFVVNRHKEVLEALRDPVTFSNAWKQEPATPVPVRVCQEAGRSDWSYPFEDTLTFTDPPKHTRLRKLLAPSFSTKRIAGWEQAIREVVHARIDGFATSGSADLSKEFAYRIPNAVLGRMIGADLEVSDRFVEWTEAFLRVRSNQLAEQDALRDWRLILELDRFAGSLIEDRRQNPADDLTTDMIQARTDDGEPALSTKEILASTMGYIGAGSESAAIMIVNTAYLLLTHPEQWDAVRSDRELIPAAVEEAMRLRGPVRCEARTVTVDAQLGGVPIPKGARVYLNFASANHDDEVFKDPEKFDVHRANVTEHIGFGKWTHFCIGASLARMEGRVSIEALIDRLDGLRLAPDYDRHFGYEDNAVLPPVKSLLVQWS